MTGPVETPSGLDWVFAVWTDTPESGWVPVIHTYRDRDDIPEDGHIRRVLQVSPLGPWYQVPRSWSLHAPAGAA